MPRNRLNPAPAIPLAGCADEALAALAKLTASSAIAQLDGATLLGERAMLAGLRIPGRVAAGGSCHLLDAVGDTVALNLARAEDRELLPALFEADDLDAQDDAAIARRCALRDAGALVARGRSMGLAMALECEVPAAPANSCVELVAGSPAPPPARRAPRVLDLSALWAGPLAAHLLWLAGADVVKVESRKRPDATRDGDRAFHALLNQGKASVVLDFADAADRRALLALIAASDIVIEAARPRALEHLGIDAAHIVRTTPGLAWVTITGHGAEGEAAGWVGFGDDLGVAGGLSAALRAATGQTGFVGDAIADPLTGVTAALVAWEAWTSRWGGRFGLSMSAIAAHCLAQARAEDPGTLQAALIAWGAAAGAPFAEVRRRPVGRVARFGEDTQAQLARVL